MKKVESVDSSWNVPVRKQDGNLKEILSDPREASTEVPNFIFSASLKYQTHERVNGGACRYYFRSNGVKLPFSPSGMHELHRAVRQSRVTVADGLHVGLWTFRKRGRHVTCVPVTEEEQMELEA